MASTSKLTNSSSSSELWDVFLSFGGKDTRIGFTSHLYSALDQVGIRTFKDKPALETGDEIASQLTKAIRDSKISIVIFSKNYASSAWCLAELAEIMECEKTKGQIVLPVFYNVDPAHVRRHQESYEEALEKHRLRHPEKVETWKAALSKAANNSGYHLDPNEEEAVLIKKIVSDVLMKLCPKYLNVSEHQVGIDFRVEKICQKLSIGSNDVRSIGIYGMPGIGKTTIAKALYNKIHKEFEGCCFLENVRDALGEPRGLHYLLEQLIFQLSKVKDFRVIDLDAGISLVKQLLCSRKVLIVLDDLDEISQFKSLAGNMNCFSSGSRIVITTRDSRLLVNLQVDFRYEVKKLNIKESLELFSWHAFRNTTPLKSFAKISEGIAEYVGGLPLALEVLGSSLFKRTMAEWKSVFEKLKEIPPKHILEKLKISYTALDDDNIKAIFLDIAFFFIGMEQEDAVKILDASGFYPDIGISILRERCLLTIGGSNELKMHNLIRDMAREIVRDESVRNPSKRSRLWFYKDAYYVLKKFKGDENTEGIRLMAPPGEIVDVSTRAFHSLPNLRLLQLSNVNLTGSFEDIFEELRWLSWHSCSLDCLPSSFEAPKLVVIDMQYSKVVVLWEGTKQLQSLKILNASHSYILKTTPCFEGVEGLEKLILSGCSSLSQIHPSIGLLHKLVHLNLSECKLLNQLPDEIGDMVCLRELDARRTSIKRLPDSVGRLSKLKKLHLESCMILRNLPSSICDLTSLECLNLFFCVKLESLPERLGNMQSLTYLSLSKTNIKNIPDSIGCLTKLRHLNVLNCQWLRRSIGSSIFSLTSLQTLRLGEWSDDGNSFSGARTLSLSLKELWFDKGCFHSLPFDISRLIHLKKLRFVNVSCLQSLPELPPNLEELDLDSCTSLDEIPNLLNMHKLTQLNFTGLHSLQSLPELPSDLFKLTLSDSTRIESLPKLPARLYKLFVRNCSRILSLPELPPNLNELSLINCTSLLSLPELPPYLNLLRLINCTSLLSLPQFPSRLAILDLCDCRSLKSLQGLPRTLVTLNFSGCNSLQKLPDLSTLKNLFLLYTDVSNLMLTVDCFRLREIYLWSRMSEDWFSHQTKGSSIAFQMPRDVQRNDLRMAFCVVLSNEGSSEIEAIITNKTDGTQLDYSSHLGGRRGVCSWVRYIGKEISIKSGDTIELSFTGIGYLTVEMCGVHFDYKRLCNVNVEQPLSSFKRLKHSA